jgi:hypothetical protein
MAAAFFLLLTLIAAPSLAADRPQDAKERFDPPQNKEQLEKARQTVVQMFQKDFEGAKSPAKKQALARQLLDNVPRIKDDVQLRYAMLTEAKDQALATGQIALAFEAIDLTAKQYRIEPLEGKIAALEQLAKTARDAPSQRNLASAALALSEKAIAASRFDDAQRLAMLALVSARKAHSTQLIRQANGALLEIMAAKKKAKP